MSKEKLDYNYSMNPSTDKKPKKKKSLIISIALFVIVVIFAVWMNNLINSAGDAPSGPDDHTTFNSDTYLESVTDVAKETVNDYYGNGGELLFSAADERTWFVEFEYDFGQDDVYKSNDYVYGYYVCEGGFKYDIPGDGSSDLETVNYTATIWVTDNANDYRFVTRTLTLTYDGIDFDYRKNMDFFTE